MWQRRLTSEASLAATPPILMPDPIWQICQSRGIVSKNEIENLFQPRLKNLAHPFSIDQMDLAVQRIVRAFQMQERILIYGDYDLDGTPAIALLHDGLTRLGFKNLMTFQPSRMRDGYGLHASRMSEFQAAGVGLIITVDVGITDVLAVAEAQNLGIDVVITDHHLPKETVPSAVAILNPNKGNCTSRLQHLCGAGVAFYLVLALKMEMQKKEILSQDFDPKILLDLFALATITDMVPLVHENRVLVKHGLAQLAQSQRPGLRHLFSELGFYNKKISSQDIGFRIAPKLNALTRLEEGVRALDVLMSSEETARALVMEALIINERRREYQKRAKKIVEDLNRDFSREKLIWVASHEFHPGVVSLIASDLMNQYNVPVFVGSLRESGQIIGSARAPEGQVNLQELFKAAESSLTKYGGHKCAAGFELEKDDWQTVQDKMLLALTQSSSEPSQPTEAQLFYDAEAKISDLTLDLMSWYDGLGPFGMGFEVPKILLRNVKIKAMKKLKGTFLKYTFESNDKQIEAPWFNKPKEIPEGSRVDVLIEPQINEFAGRRSVQGLIFDMRLS